MELANDNDDLGGMVEIFLIFLCLLCFFWEYEKLQTNEN
jgi:hypothetical protein